MAIKTLNQLSASLDVGDDAAKHGWRLNKQIKDLTDSIFAVGGLMSCSGETHDVTTSFEAFNVFTKSSDTKGVNEDLAAGTYTVTGGGDGAYAFDFSAIIIPPGNGSLIFQIVKNGELIENQLCDRPIFTGADKLFIISGGGKVADGDILAVAVKGTANATVNVVSSMFRIHRI